MRTSQYVNTGSFCLFVGGIMNGSSVFEQLYSYPVIMALKNNKDLENSLENENKVVFVLYGNIETIPVIVDKLKAKDKIVIVHEDLIEGLSNSYYGASFIKKYTNADGIITTKASNASYARKLGLFTVLRFFVFDSMGYENMKQTIKNSNCDVIEMLPGIMPKLIKDIKKRTNIPVIAGGLITSKEEVMAALSSDAVAISSSNYKVWQM